VESRVVLRGEALAQRWSDRERALARSVDVSLDGAGVVSNLQPAVPWARERDAGTGVGHPT
jgi:nitrogen-specific signal transduction histidine kinase